MGCLRSERGSAGTILGLVSSIVVAMVGLGKRGCMRPIDVHSKAAASVGVSRVPITATSSVESSWKALWLIWTRIGLYPATAFVFLSLTFGSLVTFATPPLRGPDEISHFLRIYSYSRGELLPPADVRGRKGIFVERELYDQLHFFAYAGE